MPTTDPYAGTAEAFTESMWREAVASFRPSGEDIANKTSGERSLVGFIPAASIRAAERFFLGYEQVHSGSFTVDGFNFSGNFLFRKNPVRHPTHEQFWCTGVATHPFSPIADYRPGLGRRLKLPSSPTLPGEPQPLQFYAGYKQAKVVLRFSPLDYDLFEDHSPTWPYLAYNQTEFVRNVSLDYEPRTETFEIDQEFTFCEGENIPVASGTSPKGQTARSKNALILVKPDLRVVWSSVPEKWIIYGATKMPRFILEGLGKVNRGPFLGHDDGTLLLLGVKLIRHPWTLLPAASNPYAYLESRYLYTVEFLMSYFKPDKGFTGTPPAQITTGHGHNNFIYLGNRLASDVNSLKWLLATPNGLPRESGGKTLFEYYNFDNLFNSPANTPK